MTRCDSYHFRFFSYSTSQSAGDLPLRSSRGSHSSRMKSRCFAGVLPFFDSTHFLLFSDAFTEAWTNLHISSTVLAPLSRAFIAPKSPNTGWHLLTHRSLLISSAPQTRREKEGRRTAATGISGAGSHGITRRVSGPTGKVDVGGGHSTKHSLITITNMHQSSLS